MKALVLVTEIENNLNYFLKNSLSAPYLNTEKVNYILANLEGLKASIKEQDQSIEYFRTRMDEYQKMLEEKVKAEGRGKDICGARFILSAAKTNQVAEDRWERIRIHREASGSTTVSELVGWVQMREADIDTIQLHQVEME